MGAENFSIGRHLQKLMDLCGDWIDKVRQWKPPKPLILDMDNSLTETYGQQAGSALPVENVVLTGQNSPCQPSAFSVVPSDVGVECVRRRRPGT
ncbi:MAG: hypothetical protein V3U59_02790, partial [Gammaproteobacteria bacterium]